MNQYRKKPLQQYKYLTFLIMLFITIFIICDITAFRMVSYFGKELPLSGFIIPILFALGDIIAETYGYRITMKILLSGIVCQLLFGVIISFALLAPTPHGNQINQAYNFAFHHIIRTNITSCFSVTSGMLANAFLISRLKIYMNGKKFWFRTLISSSCSEIVLCTVAYFILFSGLKSVSNIIAIIYCIWSYKVVFSTLITPATSFIGKILKRLENSDVYDYNISYNPLHSQLEPVREFDQVEKVKEHIEDIDFKQDLKSNTDHAKNSLMILKSSNDELVRFWI